MLFAQLIADAFVGVILLLQTCRNTLAVLAEDLLFALFALSQDDWPQVAEPCLAFLKTSKDASIKTSNGADGGLAHADAAAGSAAMLRSAVLRLFKELPDALWRGEAAGKLHARTLAPALQVGPLSCIHYLLQLKRNTTVQKKVLNKRFATTCLHPFFTAYSPFLTSRNALAVLPENKPEEL